MVAISVGGKVKKFWYVPLICLNVAELKWPSLKYAETAELWIKEAWAQFGMQQNEFCYCPAFK